YYDSHVIYSDDMLLTDKDGGKVLSLTPEKWEMIETVQLNVFVDDGEGFIDLGMDNVYEFDDDGDLIIDYDRTWLALDGQVVPYYMMSDVTDAGVRVITGRVPAELNGELVYIIIVFDESDPATEYGYVVGARNIYDEDDPMARGLIEIKDGDRISFICDYYRYDGTYKESCLFGETITVNGPIEVSNVSIGSLPCRVTYCLTDIYANEFWTESVEY
ncbi:MAG: peptidase C11, partial [Clostridia bacterium]|nr:peptidase C11 [Clostridia bacterium]